MRLGQTSFVYFVSRITASVLGFVATVYFARVLGPEPLGIYFQILAVVSWLLIGGTGGISKAITKRISEGTEQAEFLIAGGISLFGLFVIISGILIALQSHVNDYVGYQATEFIVVLLLVGLGSSFVHAVLNGEHAVHVSGILSPIQTVSRSIVQVVTVFLGLGVAGLLWGYAFGGFVSIFLGVFLASTGVELPTRDHFRSLFRYAKFSWLGSVKGQAFNWTDIVILGFFVSSGLIGIYAIAWNIASFLGIFAKAITATLFPELSRSTAAGDTEEVEQLVETALSNAGLVIIPGSVGALLIGERILRIYGSEFAVGSEVLIILVFAHLVMAYDRQLINTLNGMDRPDLAFRVNAAFVTANVFLNIVLIWRFGWIGAAVGTALSALVGLTMAYRYLFQRISVKLPVRPMMDQWIAALMMGGIIFGLLRVETTWGLLKHNFALLILAVPIGAAVYFGVLLGISMEFRKTVRRNVPELIR